MNTSFRIQFSPATLAAMARFKRASSSLMDVLRRTIDRENQLTIAHIVKRYASYPKQGPTMADGLRVQSGQYRRSVWASPAVIKGSEILSTIGSPLKYAGIHETGGTVPRPPRMGSVRLATDSKGVLVRQANGRLAVFAKKRRKNARTVDYTSKESSATYPARAPMRRGIQDRQVGVAIDQAVAQLLGSLT